MEQNGSKTFNILDKSVEVWLQSKRGRDGAENLWRIHDNLYDVSSFIQKHPGGSFWLETTKGMDITEAFESHHIISDKPEQILKDFYVRKAKTSRNSPYTFEENGFYKTLKRRVNGILKTIPKSENSIADFYTDTLLLLTFLSAIITNIFWSFKLSILTGFLSCLTINASHNYIHKRNNFRMYYIEVCGMNSREFRIIHVLSHHFNPNTTADLQVCFAEPFLVLFPKTKSFAVKYISWLYGPLVLFPLAFHVATILRFCNVIMLEPKRKMQKCELLSLLLPLSMYLIGRQSLLASIGMWQIIMLAASFWFCIISLTNSHIHPEVYIEGDAKRSKEEIDWGINQLDTVCDRYEIAGNTFLTLISFGDHALHHLFPTLDHSILHHLYPIALNTMKEFNIDIRMVSQSSMFLGYFRRMAKDNKSP